MKTIEWDNLHNASIWELHFEYKLTQRPFHITHATVCEQRVPYVNGVGAIHA